MTPAVRSVRLLRTAPLQCKVKYSATVQSTHWFLGVDKTPQLQVPESSFDRRKGNTQIASLKTLPMRTSQATQASSP
ncbi:hypothetical protein KC19_12G160900 [Ceratodon purpureus]|uniref:Uncharacterized protein n=1 Tax=Ceratodon purpureus TaxID=3225 RepID=A0A8T0G7U7_CERPU|nr:hypothetical protein KC19_12G160900 [Ceratodon purpureus]